MSVTPRCLLQATQAPATETTIYTAPANTRVVIDKCSGTNVSGAAVTVTMKIIPAGGSAADGNIIVKAKTIGAGEDWGFPAMVGQKLESLDSISVIASAATSVNLRISGTLITT